MRKNQESDPIVKCKRCEGTGIVARAEASGSIVPRYCRKCAGSGVDYFASKTKKGKMK